MQELLKTTLGEHDYLQKLLRSQRKQLGPFRIHIACLRCHNLPGSVNVLFERLCSFLDNETVTALTRSLIGGGTADPEIAPEMRELQHHLGSLRWRTEPTADLIGFLIESRHEVIERVHDRIQDRRLPGTGFPGDQEQSLVGELGKINGLPIPKRAEPR